VYVLDPQEKAAEYASQKVRVKGAVSGDTLNFKTIEIEETQPKKGKAKKS